MKSTNHNFRNRLRQARQRGNTLMETLAVLAIISLLLVFFVGMTQTETERLTAKNTADRMTTIGNAAKAYMTSNYAKLLASAPNTGSGAQVIRIGRTSATATPPANSLQALGFLPDNFVDTNAFQQQTALLVRKVNTKTLEAMLTTYGGREIPDRILTGIAKLVGPAGGYVPAVYTSAADQGDVLGIGGGWRTDAAQWGAAATRPDTGSLQMTMMFEDGELLKDYLYRNDVGVAEANRMNTSIDVNGNALNNTATITGVPNTTTGSTTVTVGTTAAPNSVLVTRDIFAGRDLDVKRNANVEGNVVAKGYVQGRSLRSDSYVDAATYVEAGTYVRAQNNVMAGANVLAEDDVKAGRDLTVERNATIDGDLSAGRIDIDAKVFGTDVDGGAARTFGGASVTLGDLLPRMVAQYSYLVRHGQAIAKPTCRGGYSRARVMVYRQVDSSQSTPNIPLIVQTASAQGVGPFVGGVAVDNARAWVRISQGVVATDNGTTWTVNWVGDPQAPNTTRQALAQTFCYYGKA